MKRVLILALALVLALGIGMSAGAERQERIMSEVGSEDGTQASGSVDVLISYSIEEVTIVDIEWSDPEPFHYAWNGLNWDLPEAQAVSFDVTNRSSMAKRTIFSIGSVPDDLEPLFDFNMYPDRTHGGAFGEDLGGGTPILTITPKAIDTNFGTSGDSIAIQLTVAVSNYDIN